MTKWADMTEAQRERKREQNRRWAAANPKRLSENGHKWLAANPERKRRQNCAWHVANHEHKAKYNRAWDASNSEARKAIDHHHRARKRNAPGTFTADDLNAIGDAQRWRCLCGVDLKSKYSIDHKRPLARGGSNRTSNLALLCKSCNSSKGTKTTREFIAYRLRLGLPVDEIAARAMLIDIHR